MTAFEDLKSQWENQSEYKAPKNGARLIVEKVGLLKRKQRITNVVLGITALVLIAFFFYIMAYNNTTATMALLLMVSVLFIRIIIERLSIKKLKEINVTDDSASYKLKIIDYYKKRIKVHYVITPIMFLLYILGFSILLPFFKAGVSSWFYTYILVSGIVFFIVIGLYVRKEIKKEISLLKELRN